MVWLGRRDTARAPDVGQDCRALPVTPNPWSGAKGWRALNLSRFATCRAFTDRSIAWRADGKRARTGLRCTVADAIPSEVTGTLIMRMAATGNKRWHVLVADGYLAAFVFLFLVLSQWLAIGVAYGIWAAGGFALTALASKPSSANPSPDSWQPASY
jgi:hypothetical protein